LSKFFSFVDFFVFLEQISGWHQINVFFNRNFFDGITNIDELNRKSFNELV